VYKASLKSNPSKWNVPLFGRSFLRVTFFLRSLIPGQKLFPGTPRSVESPWLRFPVFYSMVTLTHDSQSLGPDCSDNGFGFFEGFKLKVQVELTFSTGQHNRIKPCFVVCHISPLSIRFPSPLGGRSPPVFFEFTTVHAKVEHLRSPCVSFPAQDDLEKTTFHASETHPGPSGSVG